MENILSVKSEEELKSMGSLKEVRLELQSIVGNDIKLKMNTWEHLYNSILAVNNLVRKCSGEKYIPKEDDLYFKSEAEKYIFFLLELEGEVRQRKLKINKMHYLNPQVAEKWRNNIAKIIHPDGCKHIEAEKAMIELNKLYQEMTKQ